MTLPPNSTCTCACASGVNSMLPPCAGIVSAEMATPNAIARAAANHSFMKASRVGTLILPCLMSSLFPSVETDVSAATLHQNRVAPHAVVAGDALAVADLPEAAAAHQRQA